MLGRSGMEEVHTIYAVSSPIILVVYVIGLDFLQRRLFPRFGRRTECRGEPVIAYLVRWRIMAGFLCEKP